LIADINLELEGEKVTAAKRWVPWLCAFTGARVAEITQLRREDFRETDNGVTIRITPEAGGTKTGQWRDVPMHPQVIKPFAFDLNRWGVPNRAYV
ncbi:MAG: hypothetical protein U1B82_09125, partial [Cypionkella sp.]|nr:hypothetical protein [Cypionkella sp.]